MKISKIFHWLYFTVMMLPCVIIPIFAIYTRNENYNSNIEIQVQEKIEVNFNQLVQDNMTLSQSDITISQNENGSYKISGTASATIYKPFGNYQRIDGHKYLFKAFDYGTNVLLYFNNPYTTLRGDILFTATVTESTNIFLYVASGTTTNFDFYYQTYDLTQMFGSGNEPTIDEFNAIFENNYYAYTESELMYINNPIPTTYNDTDVGSQFVYTLYNATDKYFNFDNFFGLNNVYSWIQLNWFSGNAPLGFAIFWHFFTYWLLASLAWLLFDLMIYVPLYIHRWLDKGAIE